MKVLLAISIFISISVLLSGCSNKSNENTDTVNNSTNISNDNKDNNNTSNNIFINTFDESNSNNNDTNKDNSSGNNNTSGERELSSFSTPLTSGVANRITNIKITSGKINNYVLKKGETFSFNEIVGPCTAEEGYKEAEIYVNKQIKYALGGGNCQVSTTLYNAVLAVPRIDVIERHEHGRNVDYIADGKDATVSYNTLDLKFTNNSKNDIKIYTWCDDVNVYAKIVEI